jgi:uncharacterized protein (DUF1499 family)
VAVLAFGATFVWHRFFNMPAPSIWSISTLTAMKIFYATMILAVLSLTLAGAALVSIWNDGSVGAGKAGFAVFLSLAMLSVPAVALPGLLRLPRLYEVTTDPQSPPAFDRVAKIRPGQANPVHYDPAFRPLQAAAYPDIKSLIVARPINDAYSAVRETVKVLNWKVIDEQSPENAKNGYIEASDRTLIFGFTDDVAIRVTGSAKAAKIDIRSSSRFGQHDLGRNAARIRVFLATVKERLAGIDRAEHMERTMASQEAGKGDHRRRPVIGKRDSGD